MKTKNFKFKTLALALFALVLSSNVWGAEVTINPSEYNGQGGASGTGGSATATVDGITISSTKAYYTSTLIREYSSGTITFSSSSNITKIVVTCSSNAYASTLAATVDVGSASASGSVVTWTGNSTSVKFTLGGQVRWSKIVVTTAASKTLSSITVKTAPSKVTYTEGDKFDPTGLVITKTYDDSSTEDLAYAGHESDFTFSPSTSTALTTSNTSVTITVGGKSTTQTITVNAKSKYTVKFYNAGEVVKTVSNVVDGTLFSAIKPTIGTGSGQLNIESCDNSSTHFMGWTTKESFQKRETAPSYVADNDAINDNMTVRAVWAAEQQ